MKVNKCVQYLTRQHIVSLDDVKEFVHGLIHDLRLNFNPDEDFSNYVNYATGECCFNKIECKLLDRALNECWNVCSKFNVSIYDISLDILTNA
jgi:hypothetical protein